MNFWERVEFQLDKKGINKKTLANLQEFLFDYKASIVLLSFVLYITTLSPLRPSIRLSSYSV